MTEISTPIWRRPSVWLASGFGLGFSPIAPGTCGALLGLPMAWTLGHWPASIQAVVIVVLALLGIPISKQGARSSPGIKDPSWIVFDEIVSLPITFFLIPIDGLLVILAGFTLNRLFDITKPPPVRNLERLPEGLGIMADDWAAGVYSCLTLHLLFWWNLLPP